MAKSFAVVSLLVSAFCFSSVFARLGPIDDKFIVVGKIYCDPCHFEFETRLSHPLQGVKVTLECKKEDTTNVTFVTEGVTDKNGVYTLTCGGDHEEEQCEVKADANTKGECTIPMVNKFDRIVLTRNMGVSSLARYVNPLGFMTKVVDSQCTKVVQELGLDKLDD